MSFSRLFSLLLVLLTASVGLAQPSPPSGAGKPLTVYFFDVGQGDAALIVSPSGKTVLIDGGPPEAGEHLAGRLRELVRAPLDLVILTHPHLDHLGSMKDAIQAVGAKRFMEPGFNHPSEAYANLLEFVAREVGPVMLPTPVSPDAFLTIGLGEGATLTIYWPRAPLEPFLKSTRSDANSNSIVARLTYGKTAFLFTGDAEPHTEEALLRKKSVDYTSTVLKVAHHGGKHSSTEAFLNAVRPRAAVISSREGNEYGHPTPEALERLESVGARIFRTDQGGEIKAVSNGTTVTVQAERSNTPPVVFPGEVKPGPGTVSVSAVSPGAPPSNPVPVSYKPPPPPAPEPASSTLRFVSLKGSAVFHREDCATLKRAKTKERKVYTSRAAAARERRAAEDCNP